MLGIDSVQSFVNEPKRDADDPGARWDQVALAPTGTDAGCGLLNTVLSCWGRRTNGVVPVGGYSVTPAPDPLVVPGSWDAIGLGTLHGCGIQTSGAAWCWGSGSGVGDGSVESISDLRTVPLG